MSGPVRAAPKPKKVSKAKKKKLRFSVKFGGKSYRDWIASLPCAICGVRGWSVAAHAKPRSVGGKAEHLVPLCDAPFEPRCHKRFDAHEPEYEYQRPRLISRAKELYEEFNGAKE